jgi:hypothetical protein
MRAVDLDHRQKIKQAWKDGPPSQIYQFALTLNQAVRSLSINVGRRSSNCDQKNKGPAIYI